MTSVLPPDVCGEMGVTLLCLRCLQTNIEIVVAEGDQAGAKIASMVREMGASALVVGLHDQSFLYK